ncbi:hypothetical protein EJB05_16669, partial [Eragrostis curvula]
MTRPTTISPPMQSEGKTRPTPSSKQPIGDSISPASWIRRLGGWSTGDQLPPKPPQLPRAYQSFLSGAHISIGDELRAVEVLSAFTEGSLDVAGAGGGSEELRLRAFDGSVDPSSEEHIASGLQQPSRKVLCSIQIKTQQVAEAKWMRRASKFGPLTFRLQVIQESSMSLEQTLEEVFSPFLMQLSKARLASSKLAEDSSLSDIPLMFQNIEKEVRDVKNILQGVSKWENEVIKDFGGIARHLDDIIEEDSQLSSISSKLQVVRTEMCKLKNRMQLPLHVPIISPAAPTYLSSSMPSKYVNANVSQQWKNLEIERKILESPTMSNLQLSYDNLDLQLKLCLLCFSIFPENSIISRRAMIHWWIGEGLVAATRSQTAEDVGKDCFEKLIAQEMIEPVYQKRSYGVNQCKLHPWIRRMLVTVARQARFFEFDSDGNAIWDFSATHRACLVEEHQQEIKVASVRNQFDPDGLLTIFNVNERYLQFEKSWFFGLRKITVLQLGRWHNLYRHHIEVDSIEFLEGLQSSKQLKYLCLRGISRITELPASIDGLSNLRILDLHACHNLERLTASITSLQMLTHLDVSECYLLEGMPRGIGLLTELQVLKGFVIGGSTNSYNCRVAELARLDKLKKLSIYIGSKVAVTEDELKELENIKGLCLLKITWAVSLSKKGGAHQTFEATPLLTSLSLPPHLEKLDLCCFPGEKFPGWLSPIKLLRLKRLYFTGGMLNTFGDESISEVWNVEALRLKFLNDLSLQWSQVRDMFPRLTFLEVFRCSKLPSFPCDKDGVWMKCDTSEIS